MVFGKKITIFEYDFILKRIDACIDPFSDSFSKNIFNRSLKSCLDSIGFHFVFLMFFFLSL